MQKEIRGDEMNRMTDAVKFLMMQSGKQLEYLLSKGFIELKNNKYRITNKGEKLLRRIRRGKIEKLRNRRKWDIKIWQ